MEESGENSWFGSWISAAKNKSSEVLEFVKKDLEEFGNAVKTEASSMVSTTGTALEKTLKLNEPESAASSMKRSFSSFLGQMNNVLNPSPSPDDSDAEAILITEGSETVTLSKLQQIVYEMQKNEKTFLEDPDSSLDKQYGCWLEIVDDQLTEERLTKHLTNSVILKNQYAKLVPDQVPHHLFWKRYLFKKALVEDELAHQEAMERRELKEKQMTEEQMTEEHLKWDQEDFATDIELSEEDQIRLLQQYEEETKQKQKESLPKEDESSTASPAKRGKKSLKEKNCNDKKLENDTEIKDDHFNENTVSKKVSQLSINKTASSNSLDLETKSSSSDGDWEKISDIDK